MVDEEKRLTDKVINAIQKVLKSKLGEYYSCAWRENIKELLETESKYTKLVKWLDGEIEQRLLMINVFCPADRNENYTNNDFKIYSEQMKDLAIMVHCKELLNDERTTTKMRESIEYTICKIYGVHYSEYLKEYVIIN